ncbi:MAG TPA: BON domain-containing protein [Terriglobales bacterium]|nr:BON domain-containing protein [Terriglobales bacterium]
MKMNVTKVLLTQIVLLGCMTLMWARQDSTSSQGVPADNTKVNQRDRDQSAPTADQQKNNISDRDMAQQIRKGIVKDKSLSTYAHNVKVVVQNGSVTLKGPVRSEDEKKAVESKAAEVAGADKVTSELEVASK